VEPLEHTIIEEVKNMSNHLETFSLPEGFVSVFTHHNGALEFIPVGDGSDPTRGFYKINRESVLEERHEKNLIVANASVFMAKRMRPGTSWGSGIGYLEVGTGYGTGTPQAPQAENSTQTALRQPAARKAITSWTNLDSGGNPTASDTNIIQFTTTFLENDVTGALVEMGLFGGDATSALGSGQMFNYKVFPSINKDNTMQLTLVWKVTW
jgi:hypothetical protein